jgi:hypothetical protein
MAKRKKHCTAKTARGWLAGTAAAFDWNPTNMPVSDIFEDLWICLRFAMARFKLRKNAVL